MLGVPVTADQLITIGIGVVCAVGLRLLLYRTRIGLDMRAVVDNRGALVMMNGGRPDRASMLSWAIGSSMACLACGILIAPYLQLAALPLTLLVINAYAAAVIGRLRSLAMTAVGAIIIGLLQSYAVGYLPTSTVVWLQRIPDTIPILVLFVALLVLPHQRLRGGAARRVRESFPVPTFKLALFGSAVVIVLAIIAGPLMSTQTLFSMSNGLALGIIGLSFVPLVGYGGQISLCQMTFAGIGAVVFAHATGSGNPFALILAFVVPAFVGALTALPAIRLRALSVPGARNGCVRTVLRHVRVRPVVDHDLRPHDPAVWSRLAAQGEAELPVRRPVEQQGVPRRARGDLLHHRHRHRRAAPVAGYGRMLLAMREAQRPRGSSGFGHDGETRCVLYGLSAGIAAAGGVSLLAGLATQFTPDSFSSSSRTCRCCC